MNNQEAFNLAYIGILKQGKPAVGRDGECLYLTPAGLSCGVGHTLTDNLKEVAARDKRQIQWLIRDVEGFSSYFKGVTISLLMDIQAAHDDTSWKSDWFLSSYKVHMAAIADKFDLKVPDCE